MAVRSAPVRERIVAAARELVAAHGFSATSVDAVVARAGASKGAFFHHFPSKAHLGRAVVDAYVDDDIAFLEDLIAEAEARSGDGGEQLLHVVARLQALGDAPLDEQPTCLMVSFIYENQLEEAGIGEPVLRSIAHWRTRLTQLLERAARTRPALRRADLPAVADHFFVTIEGAFLLARATKDPGALRRQLGQLRAYLELLLSA
jgi:TetR/AcrR family transcriptional repressor of nem operon